jgi:competence protein ComEC
LKKNIIISLVFCIILFLFITKLPYGIDSEVNKTIPVQTDKDLLTIHFVDVGQGDCIYIHLGNYNMIIDAGNNIDGKRIVAYLKERNVTRLDYVIATHSDADHIGGLDNVIESFDIGQIYMPKVGTGTKTFEDVLDVIIEKKQKVKIPKGGDTLNFSEAEIEFIGPLRVYDSNNNNSIVIRLIHYHNTFLFTGDMEKEAEKDILEAGYRIEADVLKIGHHGSNTSTTKKFLKAVNPAYGVISCGKDNVHGHPHKKVLRRLKKEGVEIYRTDQRGTIIFSSNGEQIGIE